jgi:hypothetical protein
MRCGCASLAHCTHLPAGIRIINFRVTGPQGGFVRESTERSGLQVYAGLPRFAEWTRREVVVKSLIEQLTEELLSGQIFPRYYNCNSSDCPNS